MFSQFEKQVWLDITIDFHKKEFGFQFGKILWIMNCSECLLTIQYFDILHLLFVINFDQKLNFLRNFFNAMSFDNNKKKKKKPKEKIWV